MRLPENYARQEMTGPTKRQPVHGWVVRIGQRATFISRALARRPGEVRKALARVLGVRWQRRERTEEERIVARSRLVAWNKRAFRNKLAAGEDVGVPWQRRRTLAVIKNEERSLAIARKWQGMGEYRK